MAAGVQKRKAVTGQKSGPAAGVKRPARGAKTGARRPAPGAARADVRPSNPGARRPSGGPRNAEAGGANKARALPRLEIKGILLTAFGILLMVAFFKEGSIGAAGAAVKLFVFGLFGWPAYFVPSAIIIAGFLMVLSNKSGRVFGLTSLYVFMLFAVTAALIHTFYFNPAEYINQNPIVMLPRFYFEAQKFDSTGGGGGFFGSLLAMPFITLLRPVGARIVLSTLLLIDIILMTNMSVGAFLRRLGKLTGAGLGRMRERGGERAERRRARAPKLLQSTASDPSAAASDVMSAAAPDGAAANMPSASAAADAAEIRGADAVRNATSANATSADVGNENRKRMDQEVFFRALNSIAADRQDRVSKNLDTVSKGLDTVSEDPDTAYESSDAADVDADAEAGVIHFPGRRRIGFSGFGEESERDTARAEDVDDGDGPEPADAANGESAVADADEVTLFPRRRGDAESGRIRKPPLRWSVETGGREAGEHARKFFTEEQSASAAGRRRVQSVTAEGAQSRRVTAEGAQSRRVTAESAQSRHVTARAASGSARSGGWDTVVDAAGRGRDGYDEAYDGEDAYGEQGRDAGWDEAGRRSEHRGGRHDRVRAVRASRGAGFVELEAVDGGWAAAGAGMTASAWSGVDGPRASEGRASGRGHGQAAPRAERTERRAPQERTERNARSSQQMDAAPGGVTRRARTSAAESDQAPAQAAVPAADKPEPYRFPSASFLNSSPDNRVNMAKLKAQTQETAARLEDTLLSFKVRARVVNVMRGPAVTQYEVQPDVGVKVNTIVNLAEDISLKLGVSGIRIAPVADRSAIGIEVPNKEVSMVVLRDIVTSDAYAEQSAPLAFAVGVDIAGNAIMADIAKMPHLLIAGATGSGKSVCVNCLILSLLFKCSPDDVKLIMIDPKVVELGVYNGIPHLMIPVVTDPRKAAGALAWAVQEMLTRYQAFSEKKVKDLSGYNAYVARTGDGERLPRIVIIIDELADLMMAAPKEVQDSICRLAQMARAAGMHLVVATQRPTVDVITGLIKSNIPSRIAFRVASQTDSRVILDIGGAEKLLGNGDMLFYPVGAKKPVRVQGAYISEAEVERVVDHIKVQREDVYDEDVIDAITSGGIGADGAAGDNDELLPEVVEHVVEAGQASTSMIQRRFKVGYSRAARIIDQMEARGIVSGFDGSKPRQVLITKQQLYEMKF